MILAYKRISLTFYTDTYFGGAHGMQTLKGYTFDLRTGNIVPFTDIIQWNSYHREVLLGLIKQQTKEKGNHLPLINLEYLAKKIESPDYIPNYYLKSDKKNRYNFQPYEIASYSEGILQFEMPNS